MVHVQLSINQHPQVCFLHTAFQPLCPKPVALPGVVVAKVQDPAVGLAELVVVIAGTDSDIFTVSVCKEAE